MAQLETWIRQDLKKPLQVQYLSGTMFSQDNAANLVGVEVFDDGEPATLGGSVSANVVRSDGGTVAVSGGTLSGNKVSVILPQAAYAIPGAISIIIKLTTGGTVTTLGAIVVTVYRSSTDAVIDPGTIIPSVQTLIAQIETAVASIPADYSSLWTSLAPAFSTSAAYTAGQYVTYNGHLYRFTANHAAGSFVNTDCTQVDVGGELSALKSAINNDLYYEEADTSVWSSGKWATANGNSSGDSKKIKSDKYFPKDYAKEAVSVRPKTGYDMCLLCWDSEGTYKGTWTGSGFNKSTAYYTSNEFRLADVGTGYKFALNLRNSDTTSDVTVEEASNLLFGYPTTAKKVSIDQGVANAGKFLGVGNNGIVVPVPATDATLQQSGVPADAKTVGDNLLLSMDTGSIVFEIGGFNAVGTTNDTLTTQVRTKNPVKVGAYGGSIGCDAGYEIRVFNYSQATFSGDYLISKTNFTSDTVELIPNTYVGFSIRNTTPAEQSDVSNSEHFVINIPEQTVAEAVEKLINGDISSYNHGPFDLYKERFCDWYSGLQDDYTEFVRTSKYADVITAFDALMALDSAYITKNELGTASGTDSQGNSYTIYEYVFKPKNYSSTINARKVPKIYMDGSIHGFEKCSTYGLYYFLKDLVTNWDKNQSLAAIRQSVEIHVIPVSNPYGFDNFQYKNGNDVNINRNFDHNGDWIVVPDGSDQNGLAAFDQPESAIIRDWILADEENILCYLNLHTNGQWNVSSYGEMNANMPSSDRFDTYYNRIFRVATNHIEEQTIRWPLMYENIQPGSSAFCGKIQASVTESSTKGTASAWANTMQRIVAMTFEGFNGININDTQIVDVFSVQAQKMNSENIGNIVIQMLREYSD